MVGAVKRRSHDNTVGATGAIFPVGLAGGRHWQETGRGQGNSCPGVGVITMVGFAHLVVHF